MRDGQVQDHEHKGRHRRCGDLEDTQTPSHRRLTGAEHQLIAV
jgi:hypothetical protein